MYRRDWFTGAWAWSTTPTGFVSNNGWSAIALNLDTKAVYGWPNFGPVMTEIGGYLAASKHDLHSFSLGAEYDSSAISDNYFQSGYIHSFWFSNSSES